MDLLHENRSIIHTGKLQLCDKGPGLGGYEWTELFVLLFDNYREVLYSRTISRVALTNSLIVVMTIPKEENGVTRYHVHQRVGHTRSHIELQSFHLLCSPFRWTFLLHGASRIFHSHYLASCDWGTPVKLATMLHWVVFAPCSLSLPRHSWSGRPCWRKR